MQQIYVLPQPLQLVQNLRLKGRIETLDIRLRFIASKTEF